MSSFVRIRNYVINLENLAYVFVEENHIDFGFVIPAGKSQDQNYIRFVRGSDLQDAEFEQLKEFILQLPDADRVIAI